MAALFLVPKLSAVDLVERLGVVLASAGSTRERKRIEAAIRAQLRTWSAADVGSLFCEMSNLVRSARAQCPVRRRAQ